MLNAPKTQPQTERKPETPTEPPVYGGQWGDGDGTKAPGVPPHDRPGKIEAPPETPASQGAQPPPIAQG
ncbi:MAG: hypothetical protein ACHP9T_06825 [Caulobacterales bacterium]|jgi:hypothetical protein